MARMYRVEAAVRLKLSRSVVNWLVLSHVWPELMARMYRVGVAFRLKLSRSVVNWLVLCHLMWDAYCIQVLHCMMILWMS